LRRAGDLPAIRRLEARSGAAPARIARRHQRGLERRRVRPARRLCRAPPAGSQPRSAPGPVAGPRGRAIRPQRRCPGRPTAPEDRGRSEGP
jgi:hypothetical protein